MTSFVKRTELDWAAGTFSKLATKKGILQFGEGDDFANLLRSAYGSQIARKYSDGAELTNAWSNDDNGTNFSLGLIVANPSVSLADTVVETTFRMSDLSITNAVDFGVIARQSASTNGTFYAFIFRINTVAPTIGLHIWKFVNGTVTSLAASSAITLNPNELITLIITVNGTSIQGNCPEKSVTLSATDSALSSGNVGLWNFNAAHRPMVAYEYYIATVSNTSGTINNLICDSGVNGTDWNDYQISSDETLNGGTITYQVRAANTNPPTGSYTDLGNCASSVRIPSGITGRYLEIQISMTRPDTSNSPNVSGLSVSPVVAGGRSIYIRRE